MEVPEINDIDVIREFIEDCGVLVYPGHSVGSVNGEGDKSKLLIRCGNFKNESFKNQIVTVRNGVLSVVVADNAPEAEVLFSESLADPNCLAKLKLAFKNKWGYDKVWRHK